MKSLKTLAVLSAAIVLWVAPLPAHGYRHHVRGHHDCDHVWSYGCEDCGTCGAQAVPRNRVAPGSREFSPADPAANLETLEGTIAEVNYLPGPNPAAGNVDVLVASGEQQTLARLAPAGVLQQNKILLKEGEKISLTGYRVRTAEGDVIVATELRSNGKTLSLRDSLGRSLW